MKHFRIELEGINASGTCQTITKSIFADSFEAALKKGLIEAVRIFPAGISDVRCYQRNCINKHTQTNK